MRALRFFLAEVGTPQDWKGLDLERAGLQLTSSSVSAFSPNGADGPKPGFHRHLYFKGSNTLVLRYIYRGPAFSRSVLMLSGSSVRRQTVGSADEVILRQGFLVVWPKQRLVATLGLKLLESNAALTMFSQALFRFPGDHGHGHYGYQHIQLPDKAIDALRRLGKGHEEELDMGDSFKIALKSPDPDSFKRHAPRIQYVSETGEAMPLEDRRDGYVLLGTRLVVSGDAEEEPTTLSLIRQLDQASEFTLAGGLPEEKNLDQLQEVLAVAAYIDKAVTYLQRKGHLEFTLTKRPNITRYRERPLDSFLSS